MNLKELEELEALLPNNSELKRETRYKVSAEKTRQYWANASEQEIAIRNASISASKFTVTAETVEEIWLKVWGADRNLDLYKKLAKEYKVDVALIGSIARGSHALLHPELQQRYPLILKEWHNLYGYTKQQYVVRSPGNDLLDYYDEQNLLRGSKTSKLSPSEIFDIRFRWQNKTHKAVKEYCNSKGIFVDNTMYNTYATKTFRWLIDEPHQEWVFDSLPEVTNFLATKTTSDTKIEKSGNFAHRYVKSGMVWSDGGNGFNGWSFLKVQK